MSILGLTQFNDVTNCSARLLDLCFSTEKAANVYENRKPILEIDHHHPALNIDIQTTESITNNFLFQTQQNFITLKGQIFVNYIMICVK